jgi:hypothetical protein
MRTRELLTGALATLLAAGQADTALVPDREIAWTVTGRIRPQIGHVYGYRLEPAGDDGTLVTSYYDWSSADPHWKDAGIFPVLSQGALRATLGILARTVARGYLG